MSIDAEGGRRKTQDGMTGLLFISLWEYPQGIPTGNTHREYPQGIGSK